jgi:transcriptional regulator with XRE-family HTH domain
MTGRPHPIDLHVGQRVRMRRTLMGMSQEELGRRLGLTFQQVQKYEKGANRISASRLAEIAGILEVAPTFFFDAMEGEAADAVPGGWHHNGHAANGDGSRVASGDAHVDTTEGLQLNRAFARIADPKVRRCVIEFVRSLSED